MINDFKIGDLVYIINDCYFFMNHRARVLSVGGVGIIIQTDPPEKYYNDELMLRFHKDSVKVQVSDGISGWVQKENLKLVCQKDE